MKYSKPELGTESEEQLEESVISVEVSLKVSFLSASDNDDWSFERM